MSTPELRDADPAEPLDAFTKEWVELTGELPTPEQALRFRARSEKQLFYTQEQEERDQARRLLDGNPELGIGPYDPDREARRAADYGIDVTLNPAWQYLKRIIDDEKRRRARRRPKHNDEKARSLGASLQVEKALRRAKKPAIRRSKKQRAKLQRSVVRDDEILHTAQRFLKAGLPLRVTSRKADLVCPPSGIPTGTSRGPVLTTHDQPLWLPHWSKSSTSLRAMGMGLAAAEQGAVEFTLHLGKSGIDYGRGGDGQHFAARLFRRIKDELKRSLTPLGIDVPDLLFFVEQGRGENPHLHGVIFKPASRKGERALRDALVKAAGDDWKPRGRDVTQCELGVLWEPVGWVGYINKYREVTKKQLGDNTFAATQGMRGLGSRWWAEVRKSRRLILPGGGVAI